MTYRDQVRRTLAKAKRKGVVKSSSEPRLIPALSAALTRVNKALGVAVQKEKAEADKKHKATKSQHHDVVSHKEFEPKMGLDVVVKPGSKYSPRAIAAVEQYLASGPSSTQKRLVFKLLEFPWRTTEELVDSPSVVSKGNKSPRSVAVHLHPLDIIDFANKKLRSHGAEIVKVRTAKGFVWGFAEFSLPKTPTSPVAGPNRTRPASPHRSQC